MHHLTLENVGLDIPIFDVQRSFRKSILKYCIGGKIIHSNDSKKINVRALENISFRLNEGDRLGVIGHNGAGKTTLLRILAGIYTPSTGHIHHQGKLTSLFNASLGLDLDETGEENISNIGMYLGMSPHEIASKKEAIVDFSGLGDFIQLPVRVYSAGMQLRLSFSIATAIEPEILIMDEGIGAGDAQFAQHAQERLQAFYNKSNILVIASHSDALITQLCNKAMLLEHGKIIFLGEVQEALDIYHSR